MFIKSLLKTAGVLYFTPFIGGISRHEINLNKDTTVKTIIHRFIHPPQVIYEHLTYLSSYVLNRLSRYYVGL